MKTFRVSTDSRQSMVDITQQVRLAVDECGKEEAICLVYTPHTTCAITVNEGWDADVQRDALRHLSGLIPKEAGYAHSEGNSDAHIKSMAVGSGATLPVAAGKLCLGRWQAVFLCEFDGPRDREVWVQLR